MSKSRNAPTAADYPSAAALAELHAIERRGESVRVKSLAAWPIVLRAAMNADFIAVADFALETGLVVALGDTPRARRDVADAPNGVWVNPTDGTQMIWIPPGPCVLTNGDTTAIIGGFSLARFPVTNKQYHSFLAATGYIPAPDHPNEEAYLNHWAEGHLARRLGQHPVTHVSYIDALAYCRWAGLALPTEWMWEKAARGPEGRRYPWGDEFHAKLTHVGADETCAVGKFPDTRTPYGCEDMVGNVSEWCEVGDAGHFGRLSPTIPPAVEAAGSGAVMGVVRGSCFLRTHPSRMAASHRRQLSLGRRNQWVGFRPALPLPYRPVDES